MLQVITKKVVKDGRTYTNYYLTNEEQKVVVEVKPVHNTKKVYQLLYVLENTRKEK